jgi:hypothetical protein
MQEQIAYSTFDGYTTTIKAYITQHAHSKGMTFSCYVFHKPGEILELRAAFKRIKNGDMRFVNYAWDSDLLYKIDFKVAYNCLLHAASLTNVMWNKDICGTVNDEFGFNMIVGLPKIKYWCNEKKAD